MRIIGGSARGKKLKTFAGRSIRPALDRIRESLFSILEPHLHGARVLDLFAGTGAYGLEALSRGARHATFVDRSAAARRVIEANLASLGFSRQATTLAGDALTVPSVQDLEGQPVDIVFIDPPFAFFDEPQTAAAVARRVESLLATRGTSDDATLILRYPSSTRNEPGPPGAETRRYGESTVAIHRKRSPGASVDEA